MSQYIRSGKIISQVTTTDDGTTQHLRVFTSINQAKLYNRTKLDGKAIVGIFVASKKHTSEQINHVSK